MKETPYRILFLEDDPTIREVLTEYMLVSGYQVTAAETGDRALELLEKQEFELAVLDICVPGVDGFEVLKNIHESGKRIAAIMLTALEDEQTQVKAFNLYADDYVIKPVSPIILLKRIETILRRTVQNSMNERGQEKGLILQEEAFCAFYGGEKLPLTLTEYLLLHRLWQDPNRVFTREQLILSIFNEDYIGNDRIIDAHVKNLRKKLPVPCVKTVIGVGYQFDGEAAGL
nr:response regulator transcription factor [uncultured Acetatifactor sp.]